ncbi:MAG: phosphotransferase [Acuticoccus sp.]
MLDTVDVLQTAPPEMTEAGSMRLAKAMFAIDARATRLTSERDCNFLLHEEGTGARYVFKVANADETREVVAFQLGALMRLAEVDPTLPVPRVVPDTAGAPIAVVMIGDRPHLACVLTFLPGQPLAGTTITATHAHQCGALLARMNRGLADYRHEAEERHLLWDISHVEAVRPRLEDIAEPRTRLAAHRALDRVSAVADQIATLDRQVIHNDLNPHNVLAGPGGGVNGIIDFGDMVSAPRVNDIATAASYFVGAGEGPLGLAPRLAGAWAAGIGPSETERALLPALVGARAVLTLAITTWRAKLHPGNRAYIMRNVPSAVATLDRLLALSPEHAAALLIPES